MRKQIVPLLVFLPLWLHAQVISTSSKMIDCGQVVFKQPVKAEFTLKNTGDKSLVISQVRTSCGCTTVSFPKEAIAPGKAFSVNAIYDARQMGHFQKEIGVYSNASEKPLLLTVKGVVVQKVSDFKGKYPYVIGTMMADKNELFFDNVNRGDMPVEQIHVMNNGDDVVSPQLMHLPPYLKGEVKPSRIGPGRSATITLQIDSKKLSDLGLSQTSIYLGSFPGDKVSPEKEITVNVILMPAFSGLTKTQRVNAPILQLSKGQIDIGSFEGKSRKRDELLITNIGKSSLSIRSLQVISAGLEVSLSKRNIDPGETAKLKVTAIRDMIDRARSKPRILMITNDPTQGKVIINVDVK